MANSGLLGTQHPGPTRGRLGSCGMATSSVRSRRQRPLPGQSTPQAMAATVGRRFAEVMVPTVRTPRLRVRSHLEALPSDEVAGQLRRRWRTWSAIRWRRPPPVLTCSSIDGWWGSGSGRSESEHRSLNSPFASRDRLEGCFRALSRSSGYLRAVGIAQNRRSPPSRGVRVGSSLEDAVNHETEPSSSTVVIHPSGPRQVASPPVEVEVEC